MTFTLLHFLFIASIVMTVEGLRREKRQNFDFSGNVGGGNEESNSSDDNNIGMADDLGDIFPNLYDDEQSISLDYLNILSDYTDSSENSKVPDHSNNNSTVPEQDGNNSTYCMFGLIICKHGVCKNGSWCECEVGWIDLGCDIPCTLNCGIHGSCSVSSEAKMSGKDITEEDMFCTCQDAWVSPLCSKPKPNPVEEAEAKGRKIAIILGSCLFLAVIVSIVTPVVLWRKRVVFVMKIVYFFKMSEDDDGKAYDAYVSTATTGRALRFINKDLAPKLESLGFRLYIPSRDQLCGDVISEEILTAIKQSRRTIMIVTPDYLKNEWSRFEVLTAQLEAIKLRQRIIPIILEDVSQEKPEMQKSIKHILDSVKCLKFPESKSSATSTDKTVLTPEKKLDKFWKRLELTMPKKKKSIRSDVESNINVLSHVKSEPKFHNNTTTTIKDQNDGFVDIKLHDTKDDIMTIHKIGPKSLYPIISTENEIDLTKYEQCFHF